MSGGSTNAAAAGGTTEQEAIQSALDAQAELRRVAQLWQDAGFGGYAQGLLAGALAALKHAVDEVRS